MTGIRDDLERLSDVAGCGPTAGDYEAMLQRSGWQRVKTERGIVTWKPPSPWRRIETDGPPPQRVAVLLAYDSAISHHSVFHGYLDGDGQYILVGQWRARAAFQDPVAWLSLDDLPPVPAEWLR